MSSHSGIGIDGGAVTIHHLDRDRFEDDESYVRLSTKLRYDDDYCPTEDDFKMLWKPAETVLGTTDLDDAYTAAQGIVVNREQGGRHMVASASAGDIFEVIHENGRREFYMCEPFGFSPLGYDSRVGIHVPASCPGCGDETFFNDEGEAVFCGLCSEEILSDGFRRHPFKATNGVSGR